MRALLINPPVPSRRCAGREGRCTGEGQVELMTLVPLDMLYAGAVLERAGWEVEARDAVASPLGRIGGADLFVVAVSPTTYADDMALVRSLKARSPGSHVAVTGTLPTARPERALSDGADSALLGEAEGALEELALALAEGRPAAGVAGLAARGAGGRPVLGPPRPPPDLDSLPNPSRHLVDPDAYRFVFTGERYTAVLAGRGCPHRCTFCTAPLLHGRAARYRSVQGVVDEVRAVAEGGTRTVAFYADTFTQDRAFVLALCRSLVEADLGVGWTCNARVDTVDAGLLSAMRRAGCRYVFYGLESGSPEVLARCRKGITPDDVRRAARLTRAAGLEVVLSAMVGLPGETRESVRRTLELALEVDADYCSFFVATPYEGTPFHEEAEREGRLVAGGPRDERHAAVGTGSLSPADVEWLAEEAFRRFVLRPRVLAREAAKVLQERRWDEVRVGLGLLRRMAGG